MLALNLTYEDVQKKARHFPLDDVAADVLGMVEYESVALSPTVWQIGVDPATVSSTVHQPLYIMCRYIVLLRVTAEIFGDFSHEWGEIAKQREEKAALLERKIIDMPRAFVDNWKSTTHMGGWGYADEDELIRLRELHSIIGIPWECMGGA